VKYFNGFSLQDESHFFSDYLVKSDFTVAGFSYGAQKAFEAVYTGAERTDRLILLSPAFFQHQSPSFLRTQLRYFEAGKEAYVSQFLENVIYPSERDLSSHLDIGTKEELEALLSYVWDAEKFKEIKKRGTQIEVFLGEKDKIIDVKAAYDFFTPLATVYCMKGQGHLLQDQS